MLVDTQDQQHLNKEAFLAFNNIGGQIQSRSIEILRKQMKEKGSSLANLEDVQEAYWQACQEIVGNRG